VNENEENGSLNEEVENEEVEIFSGDAQGDPVATGVTIEQEFTTVSAPRR
jgi:hypothetical protein